VDPTRTGELFPEYAGAQPADSPPTAPLPRRVAPQTLEEIVGQEHLLAPGKPLRRAIESDRITSLILYGPPGSGKTALARVIARRTQAAFIALNAVLSGVKELREVVDAARARRAREKKRTLVFIDEIHRFNRAQQDALLPSVENGDIILLGATTENPFFSVTAPLLSRSQIFELRPLSEDALVQILRRALQHPALGIPRENIEADPAVLEYLARYAEGDARRALLTLEMLLLTTEPIEGKIIKITLEAAQEVTQKKLLHYDDTGDAHYDIASAFIKSIRGSHPDAALYWLARMLEAGETPRFVARRLCIAAAEDIGNADPLALVLATAAWQATEFIGMPEARILLAQVTTYLAAAPKSNAAYHALESALAYVREQPTIAVPPHLRDASYKGAARLEHGKDYQYPHDYPGGYIPQNYGVPRGRFYDPTDRGAEREIRARLEAWAKHDEQMRQDRESAQENQDTKGAQA